jgi:hypothetical protein
MEPLVAVELDELEELLLVAFSSAVELLELALVAGSKVLRSDSELEL